MSPSLITTIKDSVLVQALLSTTLVLFVIFVTACVVYWGREKPGEKSASDPETGPKKEDETENVGSGPKHVLILLAVLTASFAAASVVLLTVLQVKMRKCPQQSENAKTFIDAALGSRSNLTTKSGFQPEYYSFKNEHQTCPEPLPIKEEDPFLTKYERGKILGEGTYGTVYEAVEAETRTIVAIKMIKEGSRGGAPDYLEPNFQHEVAAMKKFSDLNSDRFVKFLDAYKYANYFYIVTELLKGQELLTIEISNPKKLSVVARELLEALKVMHANGWRHRDIKPDNIFLTTDGKLKLLDFGLAGPVGDALENGTPYFAGYEVLPHAPHTMSRNFFTSEVDGAPVLFESEKESITCYFRQYEALDIYSVGASLSYICSECENGDKDVREFFDFAMHAQPWSRPTAASLLKHPFITKYKDVKLCDILGDLNWLDKLYGYFKG